MTKNGQIPIYEYREGKMETQKAEEDDELEISGMDVVNETLADDTIKETQQKKEEMASPKHVRLCNGEVFFIKDVSFCLWFLARLHIVHLAYSMVNYGCQVGGVLHEGNLLCVINSILSHLYTDILQTLHIVTVHTFKMCM
jgi:hypothetical protein